MVSDCWRTSPPLRQVVVAEYRSFNVFQLMRLLLRHGKTANWPIGKRLRFFAELGSGFQGTEITRMRLRATKKQAVGAASTEPAKPNPVSLYTSNYCLASELGPLPEPFLEWVREQQRDGSDAMAAFLNIFNQRIHVLRYELRQRSLRALDTQLPADTRYAANLAALMGLGLADQQAQIALPKRVWLGIAALLVNNRRSADIVTFVMARFLGVPVRLRELVGRWRSIEVCDRTILGRPDNRLGYNSLLGKTMWDSQAGVRLEVGCQAFEQVLQLLPLRTSRVGERLPVSRHAALTSLIRLLLDCRYDCDVRIEVDRRSIPASHLTSVGPSVGLRLAQTAWLISAKHGETISCSTHTGHSQHANGVVEFCVRAYAADHDVCGVTA